MPLGQTALTLADWAKRVDPNGKVAAVIEILNLTNEIIDDMLWLPSNEATKHTTTVRSGLPAVAWRMLNYGVQPSKSTTVQITDSMGMLEAYAEIDKKLADLNGNTAAFRLSEDKPFLEAMNEEFCTTLFYGSVDVDAKKFTGFSPRYSSLSTATAQSADNVINGGGSGNTNASIWLVVWGDTTVHGIYPKGMTAGLQQEDKGQHTLHDAVGGRYEGYRTHYSWDCGLTVRDWRYAVRVANIDVTALTKNAASGADLTDLMVQALDRVRSLREGSPSFYVNRTIYSMLHRQAINKTIQSTLSIDGLAGQAGTFVMRFGGVPVKRVDALLSTESAIS